MSGSSIATFTAERCLELAELLEYCCTAPLSFDEEHPNAQSAVNHIHLFSLEHCAEHYTWIDLEYRTAFVEHIFDCWRGRLKGLPPYRAAGYRFYLYEDLAPTISVVAETPHGFPYDERSATFVASPREIMALYVERRWSEMFKFAPWPIARERLLEAVEANSGSISKPTADMLGVHIGKLRILIQQMGLEAEVNVIRKRYRRRPAALRQDADPPYRFRIYERRLPARYR